MDPERDVLEAYATLRDANWGLKLLQKVDDVEEGWEESIDEDGCMCYSAEDLEGDVVELRVERVAMKPAGTVEEPELSEDDEEDEEDDGEDDENNEEEEEEGEE